MAEPQCSNDRSLISQALAFLLVVLSAMILNSISLVGRKLPSSCADYQHMDEGICRYVYHALQSIWQGAGGANVSDIGTVKCSASSPESGRDLLHHAAAQKRVATAV